MKRNIYLLTILLLSALFYSCSNSSNIKSYTITGDVKGFPEGAIIELLPVSHDMAKPLAEAVVTNSTFEFEGSVDEPLAVFLKVKDGYGFKYLMIENKQIKIDGEVKSSVRNDNNIYDFSNVNISGSPLTEQLYEKISIRDKMDDLYQAMTTKHKDVSDKMAEARKNNDAAAFEALTKTDEYKAMEDAEMEFFSTVETSYEDLIMSNKDTYWGPLLMITLLTHFNEDQKPWYEALSEEAKNSYYGKMVFEELYPAGSIGTKVPEFTVKAEGESGIALTELIKDKKYVLIDFWASWCNPCLKEIPNLKDLYSKHSNDGFEIISISIDEKEEDWIKKSSEVQLPWPSFLDTDGVASLYKVKVIPTMYLIDSSGVIVAENIRGEDLKQKLDELF